MLLLNITKLIISADAQIAETIVERLSMKSVEKTDLYSTYEVLRVSETDDEDERIILAVCSDSKDSITETLTHVYEAYQVFKIIHIGLVGISGNVDIHSGDIVLPNTFISPNSQESFFLDFAVWENYDFKNFWLVLSGICMTGELPNDHDAEDYWADIYDWESFFILEGLKEKESLDKIVVIKWVFDDAQDTKKEMVIDNSLAILDFIL